MGTELEFLGKWGYKSKMPTIVLLGIHPRKIKADFPAGTHTWMFKAILFILTPSWKLPKRPSVDEWLDRLVHLYYEILLINKSK